jgi:hypothetical protein
MIYKITQGSIAAVITINANGADYNAYYMAADKPAQLDCAGTEADAVTRFMALPLEVRAAVNKQFHDVFAVPLAMRGEAVKNRAPFFVEV